MARELAEKMNKDDLEDLKMKIEEYEQ